MKKTETKSRNSIIAIALIALSIGGMSLIMTNAQTTEESYEGTEYPIYGCGFMSQQKNRGPWSELTQEQADELKALIESMRTADVSPQEIREVVAAKLDEWGLNAPQMQGPRNWAYGPWASLTEEQQDELRIMIDAMRELGAEPSEIHDAIKAKLEEWGIELPPMQGPGPRGFQSEPNAGCGGFKGQRRWHRGDFPNGSTEGQNAKGMRFGKGNA